MKAGWVWLAVLAAGMGAFLYGGTMDVREPMAMPLVYAGTALAAAALAMLLVTWRKSRRRAYAEAVQATDAIARWRIYGADMAAFRAVDTARARRLWSLSNSLKLPGTVPLEGFPVVVGEETLLIGDKYYDLGMRHFGVPGEVTLHEGRPGFLEISCYIEAPDALVIVVLRIPVPAQAWSEAAKAHAHLLAQVKPEDRDRLRSTFGDHFEAAAQPTDAPHRMQRRRKVVLPLVALFILGLAGFLLYSVVLRPQSSIVPNETFPSLSNETDGYPAIPNQSEPLPDGEASPPDKP